MQQHKIRRLPVINPEGELQAVLSMNDIVLNAKAPRFNRLRGRCEDLPGNLSASRTNDNNYGCLGLAQ